MKVIDHIAYDLFMKRYDKIINVNYYYFACHKNQHPYCVYYDEAEQLIRKKKIEKIMNKMNGH